MSSIRNFYKAAAAKLVRFRAWQRQPFNNENRNNGEMQRCANCGTTFADNYCPLAELTDGEDIFNKIVEPYRGRYIYIDVWGTWCAPCKQMMAFVPQMKEKLKDLDLVYLYLCNRSSEESWKTAINQFHLTGENCIHYNLPEAQQSALERYIGVSGYPTYKIVMPNGKLLPTQAPRPDRPGTIRMMIYETKNNK